MNKILKTLLGISLIVITISIILSSYLEVKRYNLDRYEKFWRDCVIEGFKLKDNIEFADWKEYAELCREVFEEQRLIKILQGKQIK